MSGRKTKLETASGRFLDAMRKNFEHEAGFLESIALDDDRSLLGRLEGFKSLTREEQALLIHCVSRTISECMCIKLKNEETAVESMKEGDFEGALLAITKVFRIKGQLDILNIADAVLAKGTGGEMAENSRKFAMDEMRKEYERWLRKTEVKA